MAVDTGLVDGVSAAIIPNGTPTFIIFSSRSSEMIPTKRMALSFSGRYSQIYRFFLYLSCQFPYSVSSQDMTASSLACFAAACAICTTMRSSLSCSKPASTFLASPAFSIRILASWTESKSLSTKRIAYASFPYSAGRRFFKE